MHKLYISLTANKYSMPTGKFKLKVGNVEVEMEGNQKYLDKKFRELTEKLLIKPIQTPSYSIGAPSGNKSENLAVVPHINQNLEGIIEYGADGIPHISIPNAATRLSQSEVIVLLLHAYKPQKLTMRELQKAVFNNWKSVEPTTFGAVLSRTLKNRVLKEGSRGKYLYSLSVSGKELAGKIIMGIKDNHAGYVRNIDEQGR